MAHTPGTITAAFNRRLYSVYSTSMTVTLQFNWHPYLNAYCEVTNAHKSRKLCARLWESETTPESEIHSPPCTHFYIVALVHLSYSKLTCL